MFFNNIIDIIMLDFFVFTMITKTRPWRHITTTSGFQDQKTTTSRFQDQNATTSSSCGILTLTPTDIGGWYIYRQPTIVVFRAGFTGNHYLNFPVPVMTGNFCFLFFSILYFTLIAIVYNYSRSWLHASMHFNVHSF